MLLTPHGECPPAGRDERAVFAPPPHVSRPDREGGDINCKHLASLVRDARVHEGAEDAVTLICGNGERATWLALFSSVLTVHSAVACSIASARFYGPLVKAFGCTLLEYSSYGIGRVSDQEKEQELRATAQQCAVFIIDAGFHDPFVSSTTVAALRDIVVQECADDAVVLINETYKSMMHRRDACMSLPGSSVSVVALSAALGLSSPVTLLFGEKQLLTTLHSQALLDPPTSSAHTNVTSWIERAEESFVWTKQIDEWHEAARFRGRQEVHGIEWVDGSMLYLVYHVADGAVLRELQCELQRKGAGDVMVCKREQSVYVRLADWRETKYEKRISNLLGVFLDIHVSAEDKTCARSLITHRRPYVFVTRKIPPLALAELHKHVDVSIWEGEDAPPKDELLRRAKNADGLLCLLTDDIDDALLQHCSHLRIVSQMAVGYNNIDVPACTRRGVTVTNTPGVLTETTAETAVALSFAAMRRVCEADRHMRARGWKVGWHPLGMLGLDVHASVVGVIGMGRIGQRYAQVMVGCGVQKILYFNRTRLALELERSLRAVYCADVERVFKEADIVSLHCSLNSSTKHLVNAERLAMMKSTAVLVNTSRGHVVDEQALISALKNKAIAAAGLDVYENEPIADDNELLNLDNVVLLPHLGSASMGTREAMGAIAVQAQVDYWSGRPLRPFCVLNPAAESSDEALERAKSGQAVP